MEQELEYLGEALDKPKRPFVAVLGGAKISGKIDVIEALLPKVDAILIGGAMACTFFKAMGLETGKSLVEARSRRPGADADARRRATSSSCRPAPSSRQKLESGAERAPSRGTRFRPGGRCSTSTRATERDFAARIGTAGTVVWNGPMGVFETPPFDTGRWRSPGRWRMPPDAGR